MTNLEKQYLKMKASKYLEKFAKQNLQHIGNCWITSDGTMFSDKIDIEYETAIKHEKQWLMKENK